MKKYKIIVYVPVSYGDALREAMGEAGAGRLGNYSSCFFTIKGMGCFKPEPGAHPAIGEVGRLETVEEERIETLCVEDRLQEVLKVVRTVHPYEEPAIDVYLLEQV